MRFVSLIMFIALVAGAGSLPAFAQQAEDWRTDYERSDCRETPNFERTVDYCRRLAKASPMVRLFNIGTTLQGRNMLLVAVSKDSIRTFDDVRAGTKPVILIQAGIHAGEIDGKDAGLMLLREIAVTGTLKHLVDNAIILFLPVFNIDGHERRGLYNRINQNGPTVTGWRVTASNLNLNRDFMKSDAPEMRAWLKMFNTWLPDMVVDIHVTDGIDFQYNLTYSMEMYDNAPKEIVAWQKTLEQALIAGMREAGDPIVPYVFPREDNDLSKGLLCYAATPRFSTGYAAIRNRAAILVETHMLKSYKDRVTSTYRLLIEMLEHVNRNPSALRDAVRTADAATARMFTTPPAAPFPLRFENNFAKPSTIEFLGYATEEKPGAVAGAPLPVWNHDRPVTVSIPLFDDVRPSVSVQPPVAYIIPNEWNEALAVLAMHGVRFERLKDTARVRVEHYVFSDPVWQVRPYEGRHPLRVKTTVRIDTVTYPKGTMVVRLNQPASKVAIHLLEPQGPDSFVGWGFFDTVFEQKEYFEEYVMEPIAEKMMADNPGLKAEYEARLKSDTTFARSPRARLQFFYDRSPWADPRLNVYPVARYMSAEGLPTITDKAYRAANMPKKK